MMLASNGEEEARLVRGRQGQGQHILDSDIHREFRPSGEPIRDKSLRVNRDDGATGFQPEARREKLTGKIISQLISEYRDQVATKKQEIEHLELKIQEFESMLQDIEPSEEPE